MRKKHTHLRQIQVLTQPVSSLKGIGPARARALAERDIHTVLDLLFFTPIRYEDRTRITPIRDAEPGHPVLVKGTVISGGEERFFRSGKKLFKILIRDADGVMELVWFQYRKPYLAAFLSPGATLLAFGKVQAGRPRKQMIHPEVRRVNEGADRCSLPLGMVPVYSCLKGLSPAALRSTMDEALRRHIPQLLDPVPKEITAAIGLPDLITAIRGVHQPPPQLTMEELRRFDTPFHRRLLFDRFFLVLLIVAFLRRRRSERAIRRWVVPAGFWEDMARWLPFRLTGDQARAVEDVLSDTASGRPMNRLLLGDVGCGKTVVAVAASHLCIRNGSRAALMAPTQILARQHFEYFAGLPEEMGFRPVLLTGHLSQREKAGVQARICDGRYNLILGTHALVQEGISFPDLGLIIIDEQQRFGVRERALLDQKSPAAHQLVMTATPIPRTLAITLYGEMDLSVIREIPGRRVPVLTRLAGKPEKREVLETLRHRLSLGQRAFVVCPLIEGEEEDHLKDAVDMARRLRKILTPPYRIGLIHGRLPPEERESVMEAFRKGGLDVLVGTTVIEVGVHVPEATLMIVEHPERFGLCQLHQLRGRVGRGVEPGLCFLMVSPGVAPRALARLETLAGSYDGFQIARQDLAERGCGQFVGIRQAGAAELELSEMIRETELLGTAREAARQVIDSDPNLSRPSNAPLRAFVESMLDKPLDI
ncbi:MAG: ATP-dependent DNA helicase RecG [Thermodesulfobacteriota bacterium]